MGILFLLLLDHIIPHLHQKSAESEGPHSSLGRSAMMLLAVTLHNIPEGMAVGVVYAGFRADSASITAAGALGIAIQNFPEGAIVSMPLRAEGVSKGKAFWGGMLSGVVEELIPEMSQGEKGHSNIGTVFFALGFTIMMALDLALG